MGIVNKFSARKVLVSGDPKRVYALGMNHERIVFDYDIWCKSESISMFFDIGKGQMLVTLNIDFWAINRDEETKGKYSCGIMSFWIENERPVAAVKWLHAQDGEIDKIAQDFKEKYAAILLDRLINS